MAAALQQFIVALGANQRTTYSYVAALTFLAYDIILSFSQEVKYIWRSKASPITVLYFIVRYYSLITIIAIVGIFTHVNVPIHVCKQYFLWTIIGGPSVFIITLDLILLLRVFALYDRSKRLFSILLVLVLGDFAAALWGAIKLAKALAAKVMLIPAPWRGCVTAVPDMKYILTCYVPNYTLSLLFLAMTLWKLLENHQDVYGKFTWKSLRNMDNMSPLLFAFVRDGSVFFALASVATFLGLIASFMVHGPIQAAFFPWTLAMYSYSGAHLVLNLRAAGTKGNADQSWNETLSYRPDDLQFT